MTRKTRFPELAYEKHAADLWRIIATDTGQAIGPHYASKAELLADLERYAHDYGCSGSIKTLFVPLPVTLQKEIAGGCQCPYCLSHPHSTPAWDTLAYDGTSAWPVHYPELKR